MMMTILGMGTMPEKSRSVAKYDWVLVQPNECWNEAWPAKTLKELTEVVRKTVLAQGVNGEELLIINKTLMTVHKIKMSIKVE
jgi:hypothetical protein